MWNLQVVFEVQTTVQLSEAQRITETKPVPKYLVSNQGIPFLCHGKLADATCSKEFFVYLAMSMLPLPHKNG